MTDNLLGILLVGVAAICGGTFALPSKYAGSASWESLWGLWYLLITVVIPIPLALFLVKGIWEIWSTVGSSIIVPMSFGVLWGAGSVMAAICYARIGFSMSYALIPGVQVIVGPLVPLLFQHPEEMATERGQMVLCGILLCAVGVGAGGYAGILKERDQQANSPDSTAKTQTRNFNMQLGISLCLIAGLLCACYKCVFSYGELILEIAKTDFENAEVTASLAVWAPGLLGGGIVAMAYCGMLLVKNGTWKDFVQPIAAKVLLLAVIMGITNWGAILFYGWGAQLLGKLGTSVGFAILFSGMLLVDNLLGFMTGEWKGTGQISRAWIGACMILLVVGICVLGIGNALDSG